MRQSDYMDCCVKLGCIPKGILDQATFRVSFPDELCQNTCQDLFLYAASRASDVIRRHIKTRTRALGHRWRELDSTLSTQLSSQEMGELGVFLKNEDTTIGNADFEKHRRKLQRDVESGKVYIPFHLDTKQKKRSTRRFSRVKKKSRVPSHRHKRSKIKAAITNSSALVPNQSTAPPPVINLSSKVLTQGHFGIFEKGGKFVPTPQKANFAEFHADYLLWKNKLRWALYHSKKEEGQQPAADPAQEEPPNPFEHLLRAADQELIRENKSKHSGPTNQSPALELFFLRIDAEIEGHKEKRVLGDNLTQDERAALKDIRNWTDVIVRPYDKGSGYVIDEKEAYHSRVYQDILDPVVYTTVEEPRLEIPCINMRLRDLHRRYPSDFSQKQIQWMIFEGDQFGYFYLNYKAHKPEKNYPGRLITSGCGSPTEHLSEWLEYHLKPLAAKCPYRLDDTPHLHRQLRQYLSIT